VNWSTVGDYKQYSANLPNLPSLQTKCLCLFAPHNNNYLNLACSFVPYFQFLADSIRASILFSNLVLFRKRACRSWRAPCLRDVINSVVCDIWWPGATVADAERTNIWVRRVQCFSCWHWTMPMRGRPTVNNWYFKILFIRCRILYA